MQIKVFSMMEKLLQVIMSITAIAEMDQPEIRQFKKNKPRVVHGTSSGQHQVLASSFPQPPSFALLLPAVQRGSFSTIPCTDEKNKLFFSGPVKVQLGCFYFSAQPPGLIL